MCSVSGFIIVFLSWVVKIRFTYSTFTRVSKKNKILLLFILLFVSMLSLFFFVVVWKLY